VVVTIRDIAREAGVSIGTVSRVLSGSTATSEHSRLRVTEAAARLKYVPNLQARALRGAGTGVLGLLVPDARNPYFADFAYAAEREALRHGFVTVLANADEDQHQQDRYLETLQTQRVDGLLVVPQNEQSEQLRAIAAMGRTPMVFADRRIVGLDVPSVTFDVADGMRQALQHLTSKGHRRIGYIGGPLDTSTGRERKDAFDDISARLGLDPDPHLTILGGNRSAAGTAALTALLKLQQRPTAVITSNGLLALGALMALRQHDLRHGDDVELLSFDDEEWMALIEPVLPVITHEPELMATTAVRMLMARASGDLPESVVLPTRLLTDRRTARSTA
jgi:LacI family transcriptional regulator